MFSFSTTIDIDIDSNVLYNHVLIMEPIPVLRFRFRQVARGGRQRSREGSVFRRMIIHVLDAHLNNNINILAIQRPSTNDYNITCSSSGR